MNRDERRKLLEAALLSGQDEMRLEEERWRRLFAELRMLGIFGLLAAHVAYVHGCGQ